MRSPKVIIIPSIKSTPIVESAKQTPPALFAHGSRLQLYMTATAERPLLTVLTPVLNAAETIDKTLESVSYLSSWPIEHIVVDGGSTDDTLDRIAEYPSVICEPQIGRGISNALNQGLARASGRYVAILNADDSYLPDIGEIMPVLEEDTTGSQIYFADVLLFDPLTKAGIIRTADATLIHRYMSLYHPCLFVPQAIYNRMGGYDESFSFAMDCEFVHRCRVADVPYVHLPRVVSRMYLRGKSHIHTSAAMKEFERSVIANGLQSCWKARWYRMRQSCFHTLFKVRWIQQLWLLLHKT